MSGEDHHWRRIASFLTIADEERSAANVLIESNPRQAAFFQQQSVEKLLRAVIEFERLNAGPTHNLGELNGILGRNHAMWQRFHQFDDLSSAAAKFRYPAGFGGVPTISRDSLRGKQLEITALGAEVREFIGPVKIA